MDQLPTQPSLFSVVSSSSEDNSVEAFTGASEISTNSAPLLEERDYIGLAEVSSQESGCPHPQHGSFTFNMDDTDLRLGLALPKGFNSNRKAAPKYRDCTNGNLLYYEPSSFGIAVCKTQASEPGLGIRENISHPGSQVALQDTSQARPGIPSEHTTGIEINERLLPLSAMPNLRQAQLSRILPSMEPQQDFEAVRFPGIPGTTFFATKHGNKRGYSEAIEDMYPGNAGNTFYEATSFWPFLKPPGPGLEKSRGSFVPFTSLADQNIAMSPDAPFPNAAGTSRKTLFKDQEHRIHLNLTGALPHDGGGGTQHATTNNDLAPKDQVVGWPPIRSFRKTTLASQPKPAVEEVGAADGAAAGAAFAAPANAHNTLYVKVNMDGFPIGRKLDLNLYDSYHGLYRALEEMFQRSTCGQRGASIMPAKEGSRDYNQSQFLGGSDYVLTYEDKDGDWMLVGDVPWGMFVNTVRRLRIMKGSEASDLAPNV